MCSISGFLVIADAHRAIGVAGVMGGRATAISDATQDVLLEAAHFTPDAIAGTRARLGIFTDRGAALRAAESIQACPRLPSSAPRRCSSRYRGPAGPVQVTRAAAGEATGADAWVSLRRARLSRCSA